MFGKNKNAILSTTLVVRVKKYKDQQPLFSLPHSPTSYANENDAKEVVVNLNAIEEKNTQEIKEGWQTEYYAVNMML